MHNWNLTPKEAITLQKKLAEQIITKDSFDKVNLVLGVDMAINKTNNLGRAALVLFKFPELELLQEIIFEDKLLMPYIPGLLSFREIPIIIQAYEKLTVKPDLILVDGSGVAHPRKIGIASHLGLLIDKPTIGCAKSRLIGEFNEKKLKNISGSYVDLLLGKEVIGAVIRTKKNTKPLFISPGHKISLESSIKYVLACCKGYRLPEPIRIADKLSKA